MKKSHLGMTVLATALVAPMALGAGFEKNITFSGKNAGKAGTSVADTTGAEALYFNPAGLGGSKGFEVSGNFSPTWGHYEGPARAFSSAGATNTYAGSSATDSEIGDTKLSPVFGLLASYGVTDDLSVGVGTYVSGGSKAYYNGQQFYASGTGTAVTETTDLRTDLSIVEYAAGAGYKLMPGLKIGASFRVINVKGELFGVSGTGLSGGQISTQLSGLSKTSTGYKLGAQYDGSGWGAGVSYRGATNFTASGTLAARLQTKTGGINGGGGAVSTQDLTVGNSGAATLASTLPQQLVVGGYYDVMNDLRVLAQYDWTEYSKCQQLSYTGTFTLPALLGGTTTDLSTKPTTLQWSNQGVYRLGAEYGGWSWAKIRAGYALTTAVTNTGFASPTLAAPGTANTFTAGLGKAINANMDANAAFEYSKTTGTGTGVTTGDFAVSGVIAHLGVNYRF